MQHINGWRHTQALVDGTRHGIVSHGGSLLLMAIVVGVAARGLLQLRPRRLSALKSKSVGRGRPSRRSPQLLYLLRRQRRGEGGGRARRGEG
jgi:hypothetical protein